MNPEGLALFPFVKGTLHSFYKDFDLTLGDQTTYLLKLTLEEDSRKQRTLGFITADEQLAIFERIGGRYKKDVVEKEIAGFSLSEALKNWSAKFSEPVLVYQPRLDSLFIGLAPWDKRLHTLAMTGVLNDLVLTEAEAKSWGVSSLKILEGANGFFDVDLFCRMFPILPEIQPAVKPPKGEWILAWSEEFDGRSLNSENWAITVDAWGGGNNELQFYTARRKNIRVENGHLVLEAHREDYTAHDPHSGVTQTREYTSGKITTKERVSWQYGKIEVRAQLPAGQGLWPAVWMLPEGTVYGSDWAANGEIDIVETLGQEPAKIYSNIQYGGAWPNQQNSSETFTLSDGTDFAQAFHTFAIEWEEGEIRWYVDDELYATKTEWYSEIGRYPAPFDQPFYLIMNLAIGGDWPLPPDATTPMPGQVLVDSIKIYQRAPS